MPANSTNLLQATIIATDPNNNTPINRGIGNPSYSGTVGEFIMYYNLVTAAADVPITLPLSPTLQVYIKNLHATSLLTVKWTPSGGAAATIIVLQPGSIIMFWEVATAASAGISTLTLNPSLANTPVEMFLGA